MLNNKSQHKRTIIKVMKKWSLFWTIGKELLARQWAKPQEQFKIAVNAKSQ